MLSGPCWGPRLRILGSFARVEVCGGGEEHVLQIAHVDLEGVARAAHVNKNLHHLHTRGRGVTDGRTKTDGRTDGRTDEREPRGEAVALWWWRIARDATDEERPSPPQQPPPAAAATAARNACMDAASRGFAARAPPRALAHLLDELPVDDLALSLASNELENGRAHVALHGVEDNVVEGLGADLSKLPRGSPREQEAVSGREPSREL